MTSYLSDRSRVELALASAMLYRVASIAFGDDAKTRDGGMPAGNAWCLERLLTGSLEPVVGLDRKQADKLRRRIERASLNALDLYEDRPIATVFAVLLYWVDGVVRSGYLDLYEGSAAAEGIQCLIDMLAEEHADLMAAIDRSARRQVPRFAERLRGMGYFRDVRAEAA